MREYTIGSSTSSSGKDVVSEMRIVIGLGNPGREYANTRHNLGFMVVDELGRRHHGDGYRRRFRAEISAITVNGEKVVLVKPQTYMNLSGHAVREVKNWHHVAVDDLLVVHDDLDLTYGQMRMRAKGSAGGHNGLASIIEQLGTGEVPRLKLGIGRGRSAPRSHVLTRFSRDEEASLSALIGAAADAVEQWIAAGIVPAMNAVNGAGAVIPEPPEAGPAPAEVTTGGRSRFGWMKRREA